ncbi:hypothetical protein [Bailinhaonella thermotolerans]|uniref:Uncharacterized protein n=1 Tax=Bailinhaonella thermotolerans TaxID=1070861 RepID=A0A3A4AEC0_9ACTN|nr:hypothetical protein [Bailinhaonella thermotolerans]RJL23993.1 hypothetical protein D5H75_31670 [Bailinhaonella thermotolerans]
MREAGRVALLGLAVTAAALAIFHAQGGWVVYGADDLAVLLAGGMATAVLVRLTVRAHGWLARRLGKVTAAALLTAVTALAAMGLVFIPATCPGAYSGRCSVDEASTWGVVTGLVSALNFVTVWLVLVILRWVRGVAADGYAQTGILAGAARRRLAARVRRAVRAVRRARRPRRAGGTRPGTEGPKERDR